MGLDWALASLHHLAIFALIGALAGEFALTSAPFDAARTGRLARLDAWYGIAAGAVLAAGLARVFLGDKGPAYYAANALFWAKMATFALIGGLSAAPTLAYLRWRREARRRADFAPSPAAVAGVRRVLYAEAALLALLPVFAAGMARGFGS
jgi:putative membrane protein